jgi:hypothetical protein
MVENSPNLVTLMQGSTKWIPFKFSVIKNPLIACLEPFLGLCTQWTASPAVRSGHENNHFCQFPPDLVQAWLCFKPVICLAGQMKSFGEQKVKPSAPCTMLECSDLVQSSRTMYNHYIGRSGVDVMITIFCDF